MSEASYRRCEKCGEAEPFCTCISTACADCGDELTAEEMASGRDECFECYFNRQD